MQMRTSHGVESGDEEEEEDASEHVPLESLTDEESASIHVDLRVCVCVRVCTCVCVCVGVGGTTKKQ